MVNTQTGEKFNSQSTIPPKPKVFDNGGVLPLGLDPLRAWDRWCVWRWTLNEAGTKWTKPPFQARRPGFGASSKNSRTWGAYIDALGAFYRGEADGVGIMFKWKEDATVGLCGIDLDDCMQNADPATLTAVAREIIGWCVEAGAYVETSPSGTGVKIFGVGVGEKPARGKFKVNGQDVEVYRRSERYFCVTGLRLTENGHVSANIDAVVDRLVSMAGPQKQFKNAEETKTRKTNSAQGANGHADVAAAIAVSDVPDTCRPRGEWPALGGQLHEYAEKGYPRADYPKEDGTSDASKECGAIIMMLFRAGLWPREVFQFLSAHPNGAARKFRGDALWADIRRVWRYYQQEQAGNVLNSADNDGSFADRFMLLTTTRGVLKENSYRNAVVLIERVLQRRRALPKHDCFGKRLLVGGVEVSDESIRAMQIEVAQRYGYEVSQSRVREIVEMLCEANRYHPIGDYFTSLKHDGVPRVDTWLTVYLGVPDQPLTRAIARIVLCAAVMRVLEPGCKFDYVLVLEGPQGKRKSMAIEKLSKGWFSDQPLLHLEQNRQQEAMRGAWLYELGELVGLKRTDVETLKSFITRKSDNVRPAWGHYRVDQLRQCIFIGTTNDDRYLQDDTGNRRFWPVHVGKIDIEALEQDVDQLWAEAVQLAPYTPLWLQDPELEREMSYAQGERVAPDPWDDLLFTLKGNVNGQHGGREWITVAGVLQNLRFDPQQMNSAVGRRVSACMKRLGWDGPRRGFENGKPVQVYLKR